MPVGPVILSSR